MKKILVILIFPFFIFSCSKTQKDIITPQVSEDTKQELEAMTTTNTWNVNVWVEEKKEEKVTKKEVDIGEIKIEDNKLKIVKDSNTKVIAQAKDDGHGGWIILESFKLSNTKKYLAYIMKTMWWKELKIYDIANEKILYSDYVDTYNFNTSDTELYICKVDGWMEWKVSLISMYDFSVKKEFKWKDFIYECKENGKYVISNGSWVVIEEKNINF